MTPNKIREVLSRLEDTGHGTPFRDAGRIDEVIAILRSELDAPQATKCGEGTPSDDEIARMAYEQFGIVADDEEVVAFGRELLARYGAPAADPVAERRSDSVMRMYIVTLCALAEALAEVADIDLVETECTLSANGAALAARTARNLIDGARAAAGVTGESNG
jgi:hypothetical protein